MNATKWKVAAGSWVVGSQRDRFVDYHSQLPLVERLRLLAEVGIQGVEVIYPYDDVEVTGLRRALRETGLQVVSVLASGINDLRFKLGALAAADPGLRKAAVDTVLEAGALARELGCRVVNVWAGQDGFDYPFQIDYPRAWSCLVDSLGQIAAAAPDLTFALEYKPREPRVFSLIRDAGRALALCQQVGATNLGITLDLGHALMAGENPAEAACLALAQGRLVLVHLNDCFRTWDDDLMVGAVHWWETLELLCYLSRGGFSGWLSLDLSPRREERVEAARASLRALRILCGLAERYQAGPWAFPDRDAARGYAALLESVFPRVGGTQE